MGAESSKGESPNTRSPKGSATKLPPTRTQPRSSALPIRAFGRAIAVPSASAARTAAAAPPTSPAAQSALTSAV